MKTPTATDLVEQSLAAIAQHGERTNAFILVDADGARAAAKAVDDERRRGVDRGPIARHADLDQRSDRHRRPADDRRVEGPRGSRRDARRHRRSPLRDAGAVLIGKTNLHEFALGTTSEESAYRRRPQSARPDAFGGWIERRLGGGRRDRDGPRVDRLRHRRLDSNSRRGVRRRRTQAVARRSADRRRRSAQQDVRSRRTDHALREGRRDALGGAHRPSAPRFEAPDAATCSSSARWADISRRCSSTTSASRSPRRIEHLRAAGVAIDERTIAGTDEDHRHVRRHLAPRSGALARRDARCTAGRLSSCRCANVSSADARFPRCAILSARDVRDALRVAVDAALMPECVRRARAADAADRRAGARRRGRHDGRTWRDRRSRFARRCFASRNSST